MLAVLLTTCDEGDTTATTHHPIDTPAMTASPRAISTPIVTTASNPTTENQIASSAAIPLVELPRVEFVSTEGSVVSLPVEIPPRSEYGLGLSGRYEIGERGMIFYYPKGTSAIGFYMKDTHVDLSIAFIGLDNRVIAIREMEAESLDLVRPGSFYHYAIEAPAGWYTKQGITPGALLRIPSGIHLPE